jgi:tRNA A37 threonylcarbamoyladenosine synthetase subunit TsaC/SUA5/YrdC
VTADDVRRAFPSAAIVIVEGHAPGGSPSTLVVIEDDAMRIVREGAVSRSAIEARLE